MSPPPPSAVEVLPLTDTEGLLVNDPLTISAITARRAKAAKLPKTVAAASTSDAFKRVNSGEPKPKSKRWDHYLSPESASRKPSSLKAAALYLKTPGIISLGGGLPSSTYFPIEEVSVKVPRAPHFTEKETKDLGVVATTGKYDTSLGGGDLDLSIALNYGQGMGAPPMLRFVTEHTELVHDPPYEDWGCCLTVGNSSALDIALRMFTERGDMLLADEYTFPSAMETAAPMGVRACGIKMDREGLLPSSMDDILSNWDSSTRKARKPRVLYTVPSGQNPTGATQSYERRKEVYRIAQKHDIIIFEDEPYYFLQMQPYTGSAPDVPPPASHEEFLEALVPSLLSLDTDGRVMRMDSFSKIIAPGTRTGWITASAQLVERFVRHNETSVQNPAGLSQIVLHKLLDENWGHAGFLDWLIYLRLEYTRRRDDILHACEKHLPRDLIRWTPPMAGMFLWIQIDWHLHPESTTKSLAALEDEIFHACIEKGVLVTPGSWFRAEKDIGTDMFFRATFAAAEASKMEEAIRRFGEALRASFKI